MSKIGGLRLIPFGGHRVETLADLESFTNRIPDRAKVIGQMMVDGQNCLIVWWVGWEPKAPETLLSDLVVTFE